MRLIPLLALGGATAIVVALARRRTLPNPDLDLPADDQILGVLCLCHEAEPQGQAGLVLCGLSRMFPDAIWPANPEIDPPSSVAIQDAFSRVSVDFLARIDAGEDVCEP